MREGNKNGFIHGMWRSRTYNSWAAMKRRCFGVNQDNYHHYGGRGITVCEKWINFQGFYEDMGDRPENTSLDRIDVNGNYCKDNCKWSTDSEQRNNQRPKKLKENPSKRTLRYRIAKGIV